MKHATKTLKNGLEIVFIPRTSTDVISLYMYVDAGSMYDDYGFPLGTAHFLEHMLFNGSEKYSSRSLLTGQIESDGGLRNGLTYTKYQTYYVQNLKQNFEKSLDYLDQLLFHPLFKKEDIERERGTILNEYIQTKNNKDRVFYLLRQSAFFKNKTLLESSLGSKSGIMDITHRNVVDFYHRFFQPKRMKLFVVGDLSEKKVFNECSRLFESYKNSSREYEKLPPLNFIKDQKDIVKKDSSYKGTRLSYSFFFPKKDFLPEEVYAPFYIFAGGSSSSLNQVLRIEKSYVYLVSFYFIPYDDGFLCTIHTDVENQYRDRVKDIIEQEIYNFTHKNLNKEKFNYYKLKQLQNIARTLDSTPETANQYNSFYAHRKEIFNYDKYCSQIKNLSPERIKEVFDVFLTLKPIWVELHGDDAC